ncbi:unnamed protein product [Rotaria sp. Silwood1]|nr:unnamed protein product [Rotaria sp. Silwood1]CAF3502315.1 unnamed protein product [Rotaria sp. Silwood1]CAF4559367.1 unnamed protein product [Rotaria sp. Silwood1]CAF4576114.1 unnamed protein product [Rotaria sp. Silwood1]
MSRIIVSVVFFCTSLITIGLHARLIPQQIQEVNTLSTLSDESTIETTTDFDPSICIEGECNPRLLSNLEVHSYELEYIYNDISDITVQGHVTINFTLKEPTNQLIYHAKRMIELDEPVLYEDGVHRLVTMRTYSPHDYVSLQLLSKNSLFSANQYILKQKFIVSLIYGNIGFYQTLYNDGNGTIGKLLASKFQPTDARKAFPCFDEPEFKAVFKISILHPEDTIAIANFPSIEQTIENNLRRTTFADTFRMSTYLAAWAILPNTYGQLTNNDDKPKITVWARREPTDKGHTALALEVALNSVSFFTDYFNTSEAVTPKIDLLAVPDFASGAMENWGLVSFREDRIIFNEKIASIIQKQQLGETMAHEIAHFWFGNYVTCKWWDDLWLNEAMATWLSYKPFKTYYPDWNMELQALTEEVIPVMWDDAKPSSHPVVVQNVTSAAEITSLFDSITYSKGASILRMLEKIVGANTFRDGLRDYLKMNAFNIGDPSIFYNNLFKNISGETFMKNWLQELNYPILHVDLKVNDNGTHITFNQSRFIISNTLDVSNLNENYRWMINIQCVLGGNYSDSDITNLGEDTIDFILETEQEIQFLPGKFYTWIKCNRDFQGFFVTKYSSDLSTLSSWQRFSSVLEAEPTFFSDEDKVNLLQDSFLLAYRGLIDYIEPLRIFSSLTNIKSKQYVIWCTFQWHWDLVTDLVQHLPNTWKKFKDFAIKRILSSGTTIDDILKINSTDDHNTKLLKGLQFSFLCRMGYKDAIERASALFKSIPVEYFNGSNVDIQIGSDFLSTVYICHLKNDDNETDWNMMYNYYKTAVAPQEQTRALVAISSTNNKERLIRLLNEGLESGPKKIKRQDFFAMIAYMSRHPTGREVAWTFYKKKFQKLVNIFTLENRRLGITINSIARSFQNESYLEEMNQLFSDYPNAGAGASARKQAVDQVNMNIHWVRSREQSLLNALETLSRS